MHAVSRSPAAQRREAPSATGYVVSAVLGVSTAPSEEQRQGQERLMQGVHLCVCCDSYSIIPGYLSAVAHFLVELTSQHKSSLTAEVVRQLAVGE